MAKEPMPEMNLYTLCLKGTRLAIYALTKFLERDVEGTVRDALIEVWLFGGGDPMQLVGRKSLARPPTEEEGQVWIEAASASGKPFVVLFAGGEALGMA